MVIEFIVLFGVVFYAIYHVWKRREDHGVLKGPGDHITSGQHP